jgi:hypothetical protein
MQKSPENKSNRPFVKTLPNTLRMLPSQMLNLLCLSLLSVTELSLSLGNNSLLLSLTGSLGLRTLGIHLLLQDPLTRLLSLGLVNLSKSSASDTDHPDRISLRAQPKLSCA